MINENGERAVIEENSLFRGLCGTLEFGHKYLSIPYSTN